METIVHPKFRQKSGLHRKLTFERGGLNTPYMNVVRNIRLWREFGRGQSIKILDRVMFPHEKIQRPHRAVIRPLYMYFTQLLYHLYMKNDVGD